MLHTNDYLDSNNVKYTITIYSPAHSMEEVQSEQAKLGIEFVNTFLLEVEAEQAVIAVIPHCMTIDIAGLQEMLKPRKIRIVSADKLKSLYPNHLSGIIAPIGRHYGHEVLMAGELMRCREIKFLNESPKTMFSVSYADFVSLNDIREDISVPTKSRYQVFVSEVAPRSERQKLTEYDSCYLGISLANPSFTTAKLIAMTDWIAKHFGSCKVLLGDSLHRLSIRIDQPELTDRQAAVQALFMGKEYVKRELAVFDRHQDLCSFEFVYCSDVQKSKDYSNYYSFFKELIGQDARFSSSVDSFSLQFVRRHLGVDQDFLSDNEFLLICQQYLIEELAIFSCLFSSDLSPILYPGSLSIFEEIANGEHSNIPESLKNMIYVSLRLKRRKASDGLHNLKEV